MEGKLTVYFDDPYWVGVYERQDDVGYSVARLIFGSEPTDVEVYVFILQHFGAFRFGPVIESGVIDEAKPKNYKRAQREVRQAMQVQGIGTKAQRAIKQSMTVAKQDRRQTFREQRAAEADERFQQRQEKKKQKQRGH